MTGIDPRAMKAAKKIANNGLMDMLGAIASPFASDREDGINQLARIIQDAYAHPDPVKEQMADELDCCAVLLEHTCHHRPVIDDKWAKAAQKHYIERARKALAAYDQEAQR